MCASVHTYMYVDVVDRIVGNRIVYICTYTGTVRSYAHVRRCVEKYTPECVCVCARANVYVYIYIYEYRYVHTHSYTVCVYIYVYIHI